MKRLYTLVFCFAVLVPSFAWGGHRDTLQSPYKFRATQLVAPAALVGLGATGLFVGSVRGWNSDISDCYAGNPRGGFDDYAQYAPFAAPYILKLAGVKSRHNYGEYTILLATSALSMGIMVSGLKYAVGEMRPDGSARNSFPSGHTATAFMGAELLRAEFWDTSPWIGIAGYAVAGAVGYMRVWHNRHWATDVLAGAGIGILSVRIAYWTYPALQRLFFGSDYHSSSAHRRSSGYFTATPYYNGSQLGTSLSLRF
ncbi:MAG: phosphatase PAP2 family protein [Rikenellaceae bacterium]|nr:phosphatase PAP2 family protein [Rikenellaceae bacterium]